MITINLDDVFEPVAVSEDLSQYLFESELKNGRVVTLKMKITFNNDPLLPNVYNMGFGPLVGDDGIDDEIKLKHRNTNKVFHPLFFML